MIVRVFGLFWSITGVDWKMREMFGDIKRGAGTIKTNAWNQYGVYCLYSDYKAIYVGRAVTSTIGERLDAHRADRLAGRWDSFSWFGVNLVNANGSLRAFKTRQHKRPDTIKALEAFAIIAFDPRLNRRHERIHGADECVQKVSSPKATRTLIEEIHAAATNKTGARSLPKMKPFFKKASK